MSLVENKAWLRCMIVVVLGSVVACGELDGQSLDAAAVEAPEQSSSETIVGGTTTNLHPAVVYILNNGYMHCTGTVIAKRKVLTAAHCLEGVRAGNLRVGFGEKATPSSANLAVASVEPHPNYNSTIYTNDIGVIHLASDSPVAPMGVVKKMDTSWVGKTLVFVGYGASNGRLQTGAGVKRLVEMPISEVQDGLFMYRTRGKNTCNGDSGGPAFFKDSTGEFLVAGVTSYGDRYCTDYGADTRVDSYLSFLKLEDTPAPVVPEESACGTETFEGRCSGNTVIWCEDEAIRKTNCRTLGSRCGYSDAEEIYSCLR